MFQTSVCLLFIDNNFVLSFFVEIDGEDLSNPIPVPNVRSQILAKVIEFCSHHLVEPMAEIEKPLRSANMSEVVNEWYANFAKNTEQQHLFDLVLAANYLDIKPLLDLTCATVASHIKGKNPDEIRRQFNIVNDFTPEEAQRVEAENRWVEEA